LHRASYSEGQSGRRGSKSGGRRMHVQVNRVPYRQRIFTQRRKKLGSNGRLKR